MHIHAHRDTHTHTHTHTHTTVWLRESNISNSQVLKYWHNLQAWVETQDPTSGPTWRALLYHKSLGGAPTDIHTVVRVKKVCLSPALTLLSFRREGGGKGK